MKGNLDRSYSCLVLLVFIKNIDKPHCNSVKQLMELTDKLGEKMGYKTDISYDTKLAVIDDMVYRGILIKDKRGITQPVSVKPNIREYILGSLAKVNVVKDD